MSDAETESTQSSAVLFERSGRFYFFQPGMGVIGSGESVSSAYEKFSTARRGYLDEVAKAGLVEKASAPLQMRSSGSVVSKPAFIQEIQLFLAKTAIVLVILTTIGVIAGNAIGTVVGGISGTIAQIQPVSMVDVADKAAVIVRDVKAMPEDRRESLRQSIGFLSRELQPLADAWRNPPPLATPKGDAGAAPAAPTPARSE